MRMLRTILAAPILCAGLSAGLPLASTPAAGEEWIGRSVTLAGRKLQCSKAEIMIDRSLPSEGGAGDDFLILNPEMLNQQPPIVRVFVFKHECGHLSVGDDELKADCFAVERGVEEGWLDRKGLAQVCQSFDGAPETANHPSAARRCRNLDQCYAKALASKEAAKQPPAGPAPEPAAGKADAPAPRKSISAWRCSDPLPVNAGAEDPIGHLITEDAKLAARCR